MALFLQILEGDNPITATPVLATRDRTIIAAVARELGLRLGVEAKRPRRLRPIDGGAAPKVPGNRDGGQP